jgi:glycosyltransferase involved in cell wall biosynthesis
LTSKTTIVFDPDISGHHREYLNHLYLRAGEKHDDKFVFVVHHELLKYSDYLRWPVLQNVVISFLDESQIRQIGGNIFKSSFRRSRLLNKFIIENYASHVFLIFLMPFLPFLPIILSRKIKVSGIVYHIPTRSYKYDGCLKGIQDYFKYLIFSECKIFDRIFLLNDYASAKLLNRKFNSSVFQYLPDPVIPAFKCNAPELSDVVDMFSSGIVFLHFGGLAERKGTLDILKSLELFDESLFEKACFVFAGHIDEDIRPSFNELVHRLSEKVKIKVFEGFCSYELLAGLCMHAHYLLIPYKSGSQSSGIVGYAARYKVPVIANSDGLMGSLIRSYKLGFTYDLNEPLNLADAIKKHILMLPHKIDGSAYLCENSIANFQRIIFE